VASCVARVCPAYGLRLQATPPVGRPVRPQTDSGSSVHAVVAAVGGGGGASLAAVVVVAPVDRGSGALTTMNQQETVLSYSSVSAQPRSQRPGGVDFILKVWRWREQSCWSNPLNPDTWADSRLVQSVS
jgi:hypothetical protein